MAYYSPRRDQQARDLAAKKNDLLQLEAQLAEREEELDELTAESKIFEYEYWQKLGRHYLELERLENQIANLQAELQRRAHPPEPPPPNELPFEWYWKPTAETPTPADIKTATSLKKLYREVAKRLHPDFATDETDRLRRTQLMAKANQAYAESDEATLQTLLQQAGGPTIENPDVETEINNVTRRIAQIVQRLSEIDDEIYKLQLGELAQLQIQVAEAKLAKHDLLSDLAKTALSHIQNAAQRLEQLKKLLGQK